MTNLKISGRQRKTDKVAKKQKPIVIIISDSMQWFFQGKIANHSLNWELGEKQHNIMYTQCLILDNL